MFFFQWQKRLNCRKLIEMTSLWRINYDKILFLMQIPKTFWCKQLNTFPPQAVPEWVTWFLAQKNKVLCLKEIIITVHYKSPPRCWLLLNKCIVLMTGAAALNVLSNLLQPSWCVWNVVPALHFPWKQLSLSRNVTWCFIACWMCRSRLIEYGNRWICQNVRTVPLSGWFIITPFTIKVTECPDGNDCSIIRVWIKFLCFLQTHLWRSITAAATLWRGWIDQVVWLRWRAGKVVHILHENIHRDYIQVYFSLVCQNTTCMITSWSNKFTPKRDFSQ